MILQEMDPILAREQFMPLLQEILTNLEQGDITVPVAITQIKEIQLDVYTIASLTSNSRQDAFEWQFILITIQNILQDLDNP